MMSVLRAITRHWPKWMEMRGPVKVRLVICMLSGHSMKIKATHGLAQILKAKGVRWVSTFPVCEANDGIAEEGISLEHW